MAERLMREHITLQQAFAAWESYAQVWHDLATKGDVARLMALEPEYRAAFNAYERAQFDVGGTSALIEDDGIHAEVAIRIRRNQADPAPDDRLEDAIAASRAALLLFGRTSTAGLARSELLSQLHAACHAGKRLVIAYDYLQECRAYVDVPSETIDDAIERLAQRDAEFLQHLASSGAAFDAFNSETLSVLDPT
jgi:hypothetical protein